MMVRFAPALLFIALAAGTAGALEPPVPLTLDIFGTPERTLVPYECRASEDAAPEPMTVEYINLPGNSLAILPVEDVPTLFVSVLSGSGAKYVSGSHVWWTKGNRGDLYDERAGDAADGIVCSVSG